MSTLTAPGTPSQPQDQTPQEQTPQDRAPKTRSPLPGWVEVGVIIGFFILSEALPGLPLSGPIAVIASMIFATYCMSRRGESWRDLGLRWANTRGDYLKGAGMVVLVFLGASLANALLLAVLPLLLGADAERALPDVSTLGSYVLMMAIVWTTAAFGEEMVFRGYLMSRFSRFMGDGRGAWVLAAVFQAIFFGLVHSYQGIGGIITTGFVGLVFGLLYLVARRNLWPMIIGHGLLNTFGITALYLQAIGALPPGTV